MLPIDEDMSKSVESEALVVMDTLHQKGQYAQLHCEAWRKAVNWHQDKLVNFGDLCCGKCHYKDHYEKAVRYVPQLTIKNVESFTSKQAYLVCCNVYHFCLKVNTYVG